MFKWDKLNCMRIRITFPSWSVIYYGGSCLWALQCSLVIKWRCCSVLSCIVFHYLCVLIGPKADSSVSDSKPTGSARKKGKAGNISKKATPEGVM